MSKEIYLAGGCFWGVEKYLSLIEGVIETEVGYANGTIDNPCYEDVCYQNTGHAETVRVVYDPARVGLSFLLDMFYEIIDPISLNRQGNDVGTQYRSGIYYTDEKDIPEITKSLSRLQMRINSPIMIEVEELRNYTRAEDVHQDYLGKNPRGYCHIPPSAYKTAANATPEVQQ